MYRGGLVEAAMTMDLHILDGVFRDPRAVRERALRHDFYALEGFYGDRYDRVFEEPLPELEAGLEAVHGTPVTMLGSGWRLNYGGELPNTAIHSDAQVALKGRKPFANAWAAVAWLPPTFHEPSGTAFWRHRDTGITQIPDGINADDAAWIDAQCHKPEDWDIDAYVAMRFNRMICYEGNKFHSRFPFAAFGDRPEAGRLIAVAFYKIGGST